MSSILDALNKLEEEKAARRAEQEGAPEPVSPDKAALELLGASDSRSALIRPWLAIVAALFMGVAATSALFAVLFFFRSTAQDTVAVATPAPTQTYTVPAVPADPIPAAPPHVMPAPSQDPPATGAATSVPPHPAPAFAQHEAQRVEPAAADPPSPPLPEPAPPAPVETRNMPPVPEPAPIVVARAAPEPTPLPSATAIVPPAPETAAAPDENMRATPPPLPTRAPTAPPAARADATGALDINGLPRLSSSDRSRLGLEDLRLNVLRAANEDQPEALAIINLKKVYVGEMIPGTQARLIAVQANGIAIEMEGTRERYRVSR